MPKPIPLNETPPEPLEFFETDHIHPDNAELIEEQLQRFRRLSPKDRRRLKQYLNDLGAQLVAGQWNNWCVKRHEMRIAYKETREEYVKLKADIAARGAAAEEQDRRHLRRLWLRGQKIVHTGRAAQAALDAMAEIRHQYVHVREWLEYEALNRNELITLDKRDRAWRKRMAQERRIFQRLFYDVFRYTEGCHSWQKDANGKERCVIPRFGRPVTTPDSHWFPLLVTVPAFFGGYRLALPYRVDPDKLTSDVVTDKMSIAAGRQVEVLRGQEDRTIWYRVNRLDSPDGLPRLYYWRDAMQFYPKADADYFPWFPGIITGRKLRTVDMKKTPHVLIGGTTGSGKSTLINQKIATHVVTHSPKQFRIVLIDGKRGVEFSHWIDLPHRVGGLVKDIHGAIEELTWLVDLMDSRYDMFVAMRKKDIFEYNESVQEEQQLPVIMVVIDELNRFIGQGKLTTEYEFLLLQLLSLGRASGIQVIAATQHPSVEVVSGTLKTNFKARVAGPMPSGAASRVILNTEDASKLPNIDGRMDLEIGRELIEFQALYITTEDIADVVKRAQDLWGLPQPLAELEKSADEDDETIIKWDEQRVLEFVIRVLRGHLSYKRINETLGTDSPGEWELRKVVDPLVKRATEKGFLEWSGRKYLHKRKGTAHYLKVFDESGESDESDEHSSLQAKTALIGSLTEMEETESVA